MESDILRIHKSCLDFLLECQAENDEFFFVPRKSNKNKRLEKGMYFLGNESYLVLSFWDSADYRERIYNINWACRSNGESYIELSSKSDDEKFRYLCEIKDMLENPERKFSPVRKNKWIYTYPKEEHFLNTLKDFVTKDKPMIDSYLKRHPESGIPLADRSTNDKYVKKLPCYTRIMEKVRADKKTGSVMVRPSEYMMTFRHNELSNALVKYLDTHGYRNIKTEDNYVDIKCNDKSGQNIFFELKTGMTVKSAIRNAIGQLLEYNHYPDTDKAENLIIVTGLEPEEDDVKYLNKLRKIYKLPIYYQYFDMEKKELSKKF